MYLTMQVKSIEKQSKTENFSTTNKQKQQKNQKKRDRCWASEATEQAFVQDREYVKHFLVCKK